LRNTKTITDHVIFSEKETRIDIPR